MLTYHRRDPKKDVWIEFQSICQGIENVTDNGVFKMANILSNLNPSTPPH